MWLYHFAGAGKMVTFRGNKDMNELILNNSIFENIKHIDDNGNEYWEARELMPLLEYSK